MQEWESITGINKTEDSGACREQLKRLKEPEKISQLYPNVACGVLFRNHPYATVVLLKINLENDLRPITEEWRKDGTINVHKITIPNQKPSSPLKQCLLMYKETSPPELVVTFLIPNLKLC